MKLTRKIVLALMWLLSVTASQCVFAQDFREKWSQLDKQDKVLYTNLGGALFITVWGVANWDYFKRSPHAGSEGWFERDTESGGVDKLGHMYAAYTTGHALSSLYESWGYNSRDASRYGAWSSFGLMTFMEVGDSFSRYGFSYEDLIMGGLGSYIGYLTDTNPGLARKLDLRFEYDPTGDNDADIFTDYENAKYLVALKADGFEQVRNPYLKYLELHLGYYSRGFSTPAKEDDRRKLYLGVGINLSKIFAERSYKKTATFFKYYQMPYSYVEADHELD